MFPQQEHNNLPGLAIPAATRGEGLALTITRLKGASEPKGMKKWSSVHFKA